MQIEPLKDVLNQTRNFHQHLASSLQNCKDRNQSERARLFARVSCRPRANTG